MKGFHIVLQNSCLRSQDVRQLISEAIDLKLLRFGELLLTGEFQIFPSCDKVINRLVLTASENSVTPTLLWVLCL